MFVPTALRLAHGCTPRFLSCRQAEAIPSGGWQYAISIAELCRREGIAEERGPDGRPGRLHLAGGASTASHCASALPGSAISSTEPYHQACQPASGKPVNTIRFSG